MALLTQPIGAQYFGEADSPQLLVNGGFVRILPVHAPCSERLRYLEPATCNLRGECAQIDRCCTTHEFRQSLIKRYNAVDDNSAHLGSILDDSNIDVA